MERAMVRIMTVLGLVLVCLMLVVGLRENDPTKTGAARLEGTWVLVGRETNYRRYSAEDLDKSPETWVIRGGELVEWREDVYGRPKESDRYRIQVNPSSTPSSIDFVNPDDTVNHAIYSLDGDQLVVCVSCSMFWNKPEQRPIRFTPVPEQNNGLGGIIVYRFKRDRDGTLNVIGRPERRRQFVPSGLK